MQLRERALSAALFLSVVAVSSGSYYYSVSADVERGSDCGRYAAPLRAPAARRCPTSQDTARAFATTLIRRPAHTATACMMTTGTATTAGPVPNMAVVPEPIALIA